MDERVKEDRASDIEQHMRPGDVSPGAGAAHPGDQCGHTGADIGTYGDRNPELDGDASARLRGPSPSR